MLEPVYDLGAGAAGTTPAAMASCPVVVIPARTVPEPEGTYFPGPLL